MKYLKGITLIVLLLFVCAAFVPSTIAERDSLKVIILAEDGQYKEGDNVTIEVQVYDAGELVTADDVDVFVQTHWHGSEYYVFIEEISTGIYKGEYQIKEDDSYLYFSTVCELGTDDDAAEMYVEIHEERLELGIHFSHQSQAVLWPGESTTATLITRYRDEPVDVDEFRYVRLDEGDEIYTELEYTRISEGVYQTDILIEEGYENMEYTLEAYAEYANAHTSAYASIVVNVLSVWYRLEESLGNTATFTLGVADSKVKSVPNAEVFITHPQEENQFTNEEGLTMFSLTGVHDGTTVRGYVKAGELVQSFEGRLYLDDPEEEETPAHHRFDVIYQGDDFLYSAGSKISRNYKAYDYSVPHSDSVIYYYITMEETDFILTDDSYFDDYGYYSGTSRVVKVGSVTTSLLGEFKISFTAPKKQGLISIYFETGIEQNERNYHPQFNSEHDNDDDLVYEDDSDYVFVYKGDLWDSSSVKINSDPLNVGGRTKVKVAFSETPDDDDELFAEWMAGKPSGPQNFDDRESEWVSWVEGGNTIQLKETDNPKEYQGTTVIPEFMDDDGDYTLVAGEMDGETGFPYANHATLKEGESAGDSNMDLLVLILLGGAVLIILIILGFGAFTEKGNNKKNSEYQYPGQPPAEGESPPSDYSPDSTSSQQPTDPNLQALSNAADMPPPDENTPAEANNEIPKPEDAREGADN
jgi:hypothetical protein